MCCDVQQLAIVCDGNFKRNIALGILNAIHVEEMVKELLVLPHAQIQQMCSAFQVAPAASYCVAEPSCVVATWCAALQHDTLQHNTAHHVPRIAAGFCRLPADALRVAGSCSKSRQHTTPCNTTACTTVAGAQVRLAEYEGLQAHALHYHTQVPHLRVYQPVLARLSAVLSSLS